MTLRHRVNSCPDFAQTGDRLHKVIDGLFEGTLELGIKPFYSLPGANPNMANFHLCLDKKLFGTGAA
jgi:tubulin--tyrosine ligase